MTASPARFEDTRRAARNAVTLAAAGLFSKGMLFVWQFVLARWLGDAGYGVYGTVGAMAIIATVIGSFGMGLIVIRDVARHPEKAGQYLTATLFMQTGLVTVAFVVMNAAAWLLGYSGAIRVFTALTGIALMIDIYGNMCFDQLLAQERMVTTSVVEALHIALRIALVALALWRGFDLLGLYVVGLVASAVRSGLFWERLARTGVRPVFPLNRPLAAVLFTNSVPLAVSAILTLIYQQGDKLMSTAYLTEATTGYLTAAFVVITGVIELLNGTILIATYPVMSRYYEENRALFNFIVEKLVYYTLLVMLPVSLTLSVFAPQLTLPLFGAGFAPTATVLRVLIWYALLAMMVNVFAQGMMVQNRQRRLLVLRVTGLAINLTLNFTLLIGFDVGVMGLVYASVAAESVVLAALLWDFRRADGYSRAWIGRVVRPGMAAAVTVFVMISAGQIHFTLGVLAGLVSYAGLVLLLRVLRHDDWDLLYRLVAAMPGGGVVLRFWRRDVPLKA